MPVPWHVVRLDLVESTNDLAKQMASDPGSAPELPIVLIADRQTRGRGRGANAWWSDPGSLTFSVLLDPAAIGLADRHVPLTSLATAVAVVDAVGPLLNRGELRIRWPNDVEIDGRKIAGILPERVNTPGGPRLVVGIGLNVRSRLDDAPADVRAMAAALAEFADRDLTAEDQQTIFDALLGRLDDGLARLARDDESLATRWAELDQLLGRPCGSTSAGRSSRASAAGSRPTAPCWSTKAPPSADLRRPGPAVPVGQASACLRVRWIGGRRRPALRTERVHGGGRGDRPPPLMRLSGWSPAPRRPSSRACRATRRGSGRR